MAPGRRTRGGGHADDGAAAVEFALVSLPLFLLLFGIIQYGFIFFEVQGAASTVKESARWASQGITSCSDWDRKTLDRASVSGVTANLSPSASADWRTTSTGDAVVVVSLTFSPFQIVPMVPVPSTVTRSAEFDVEFTPPNGVQRASGSTVECP